MALKIVYCISKMDQPFFRKIAQALGCDPEASSEELLSCFQEVRNEVSELTFGLVKKYAHLMIKVQW